MDNAILNLGAVKTLVFAGGGNRCWWQAGLVTALLDKGWHLPADLVGTSAGAAIAASCVMGGPERALRNCLAIYADNDQLFDWRGLARLRLVFAHQSIYPRWIESFLDDDSYRVLRGSANRLTVAVTRPARYLGLAGSVLAGTLAYFVDKYLWKSIHPRLPTYLGLRQGFVVLNDCPSILQARHLLCAAAAAPPFMSALPLEAGMAFDGGFTDNAPIPLQSPEQRDATLVLLTRHYSKRPKIFSWRGRTYWQPSGQIPVSTWDCTNKATVQAAFDLGRNDAQRVVLAQ